MIDLYCERLGPGLWAEPLNALTNLAFLVAAWASWQLVLRSGRLTASLALLTALVAVIGIGSGLFHTFATPWARLPDVLPILIFEFFFLWLYSRNVIGANRAISALVVCCLLVMALLGRQFPEVLNGSLTYVPALVLLLGLGIYHYITQRRERFALVGAAEIFAASLVFRALDQAVCGYVPIGTHFLWHLLNAVLLYVLVRSLVANSRTPI